MTAQIVKATQKFPDPRNDAAAAVARNIERFIPVLPPGVETHQILSALIVASNDLEQECTPKSVLMAAYACATMGLMPGKTLGLAYFVPYKGECTLIPGYRGYMELAFRNRFLKSIHADVVYQGEEFRHWATEEGPKLIHEPSLQRDTVGGLVVAAYCISQLESGGRQIRVMSGSELQRLDKGGMDRGGKVWAEHRHEMLVKSVIRRAAKSWRQARELSVAIRLDEQAEAGDPQDVGLGEIEGVQPVEQSFRRRTLAEPQPPIEPPSPPADPEPHTVPASPMVATWGETLGSCMAAAMHAVPPLEEGDVRSRVKKWALALGVVGKEDKSTRVSQRIELVNAIRESRLGADGKISSGNW